MVDDPVVEGVAGQAHSGVGQRLGADFAGLPMKAHDGEIAGAAAEVAHQHRGVLAELAGEEERRRHRLEGVADIGEAETREGSLVTGHGQRGIGAGAGEIHRPADDGRGRQFGHRLAGVGSQTQQEGGEQVLEGIASAEDPGLPEEGAGGVALERLDEARLQRLLHIGLDRPRPGLHHPARGVLRRGVKAQRRAKGDDLSALGRKGHQMRLAAGPDRRDDGVGRAKINADRARQGGHGGSPS